MVDKRSTILKALDWLGQPNGQFLLIAGITLLAALLRFYKLGEWSFWGDEIFTLGAKEDGFGDSLWRRSLARDLIHVATATLGETEWSARLVPALVGVITVPALYFPVRRLMGAATALARHHLARNLHVAHLLVTECTLLYAAAPVLFPGSAGVPDWSGGGSARLSPAFPGAAGPGSQRAPSCPDGRARDLHLSRLVGDPRLGEAARPADA